MTLVTWAWSPPTWVAMLPQKFSTATTSTFPPDADEPVPRPHALMAIATRAPTTATSHPLAAKLDPALTTRLTSDPVRL